MDGSAHWFQSLGEQLEAGLAIRADAIREAEHQECGGCVECQVCADGERAAALVTRVWHDGTVDEGVRVCHWHMRSGEFWTMTTVEWLAPGGAA